jgi:hypothetical protein
VNHITHFCVPPKTTEINFMFKKAALVALTFAAMASGAANANVISQDFTGNGEITSPGSLTWNVTAPAGNAQLDVHINGFASLDGAWNCCTDVFHLFVNSNEIFSGSFDLGGGGYNVVWTNTNGATFTTSTPGMWQGGSLDISTPVWLNAGSNNITFSYSGDYQGLGDEGWGVGVAQLTTANTPEPAGLALLGLGLLGLAAARRKA